MTVKTITARDVADVLESIAPISTGNPGDELGFIHGDPNLPVRGVACMWNAHSGSIRRAAERGHNLLMVHETLFYAPQDSNWYQGPQEEQQIIPNQKRRQLLEQHDLAVYRSHSNWDALDIDGVPDQAVAALGLGELKMIGRQKYFKVHELPAPMRVSDLAERARIGLGLPSVRVFGQRDRRIQRFCFAIGGFGGNQMHLPQAAAELGAEAMIIGEMLEWITIAALECGLPVIETLHSRSEIPAIKRQAQMLQQRFPDLRVEYIDSGAMGF